MPTPVKVITGTKQAGTTAFKPRTADGGTLGSAVQTEGMFRSVTTRMTREQLPPIVTMATTASEFAKVDVGAATGTITYNGYMSQDSAASNPLYFITQQFAGGVENVFGTGNTMAANVAAIEDENTFAARANSARGTTFVITDTPTATWADGST